MTKLPPRKTGGRTAGTFDKKPAGFARRKASYGEGEGPRVERATIGNGPKKSFGAKKSFGDKKPFGERKSFGDKKPFGDKKSFGEKKSFGDRPFKGERSERPARSFEGRSERPRRDFEDRPRRDSEDRPRRDFAERGERPRRDFEDRPRRDFAERSERPRRDFEDRPRRDNDEGFKEKRSFDKKPYGERKSFGDKKPYGERKSFGDKKPYGERKSFGDKKPYGERKSFGDRPARGDRPERAPRFEGTKLHADPNGTLLWGTHAVREALINKKRKCTTLWVTDSGRAAIADILESARLAGLERPDPVRVEKEDLERLLPRGTVHQGVVMDTHALPEMTIDDLLGMDEGTDLVVILDQVTDPHNVGAILRSAAAFGAGAVIVTERNAPGTTGILAKTACGACEHVPLIPVVNLARALDMLKAESFWIIGLAEEGERDLCEAALSSGRIALVMGAEGDGLRRLTREHCDELARLPTGGAIGSLNVSNAAAVSLYEARRQKNANK